MAPRPKLWDLDQKIMAPRLKFSMKTRVYVSYLVFSIDGLRGQRVKRVKSNKYSVILINIVKKVTKIAKKVKFGIFHSIFHDSSPHLTPPHTTSNHLTPPHTTSILRFFEFKHPLSYYSYGIIAPYS